MNIIQKPRKKRSPKTDGSRPSGDAAVLDEDNYIYQPRQADYNPGRVKHHQYGRLGGHLTLESHRARKTSSIKIAPECSRQLGISKHFISPRVHACWKLVGRAAVMVVKADVNTAFFHGSHVQWNFT